MLLAIVAPMTGAAVAAVAATVEAIDAAVLDAVASIGIGTPMAVVATLASAATALVPARNLRVLASCVICQMP